MPAESQPSTNGSNQARCESMDYGIQEFSLFSSLPVISNSYDLHVAIEQIGGCEIDSLSVSLFEDDTLAEQHKITDPSQTQSLKFNWVPKTDQPVILRVELAMLDDDLENNSEEIAVVAYPLGSYTNIKDLSADKIGTSSAKAEMFTVQNPLHISSADVYLRGKSDDVKETGITVTIYSDDAGKPAEVLKQVQQQVKVHNQFDWVTVPLDVIAPAGNYWLALSSEDPELSWHYSRQEAGGAVQALPRVVYKENKFTLTSSPTGWEVVPEKDYTYKVHAIK